MKSPPVLQTERLTLRGIKEEDAPFIAKIRSDPDVYPFFLVPRKLTAEEHLKWFREKYIYDDNRIDWIGFRGTDIPVGIFGIKRSDGNAAEAEISYILDPAWYGKGFAREAIEKVLCFAWENWNIRTVTAEIHRKNINSVRFACKIGMVEADRHGDFIVFRRAI